MEAAGGVMSVNVAVTVVAAVRVTVQVPLPEQPPPVQPLKVEPAAGAAVSVTAVPLVKLAEQVAPQVMPAGELVTVPLPVPALLTVSAKLGRLKVAVTVVAAETVTKDRTGAVQGKRVELVRGRMIEGKAGSVTAVPRVELGEDVGPK